MVETFELEVPHVSTVDNIADFFTKPMHNSKQFFNFRRIIMNEPDPTAIHASLVASAHRFWTSFRGGASEGEALE